jgi:hypothetical protein
VLKDWRELKDLQSVCVVIDGGEPESFEAETDSEPEGAAARAGVHLELGHKLAGRCEFH